MSNQVPSEYEVAEAEHHAELDTIPTEEDVAEAEHHAEIDMIPTP